MAIDVVGKLARVTADITPGHLGEVLIEVRAGTERFLACASDKQATITKHSQVLVVLFRAAWRVAEPDEALIVSGFRTSQRPDGVGESMGFRIVTGRGCLVDPGITRVSRLSLEAHESEIGVRCVSQQKIRVDLRGVIVYKVGDDYRSIATAARRFLDRPAQG